MVVDRIGSRTRKGNGTNEISPWQIVREPRRRNQPRRLTRGGILLRLANFLLRDSAGFCEKGEDDIEEMEEECDPLAGLICSPL